MLKKVTILVLLLFLVGCGDKPKPPQEEPTLETTVQSLTLMVGDESLIQYTTNQEGVSISVEDPTILSLTGETIKALKVGTTQVILKVSTLEKKITVTVNASIDLSLSELYLRVSETHQINASSKGTLKYTSLDESIATVSNTGLITALEPGDVVIRVSLVENEAIKKDITLTIVDLPAQEKSFILAKQKTESLKNYTLKITIKEPSGENTYSESVVYYKFDNHKFSFVNPNTTVYYEIISGITYEYKQTLDGYIKTEVEALPSGFMPFYYTFNYEMFDYLNEAYFLTYVNQNILDGFKQQFPGATTVNNLKLTLADDYYHLITFNLTIRSVIYHFMFEFIDIATTTVDIPQI